MFYKEYILIYEKIAQDLQIQLNDDKLASDILNDLLKKENLISIEVLENLISDKEVVVFGAGPSLEKSVIKHKKNFDNMMKIAADGATTVLLEYNILPDFIVTDLDGKVSDQLIANSKGSIMVIHAHGNNIEKLEKYVSMFKGKIIGTTQINPESYDKLHNFYGFTDGDRAAYFADYFNAKKINLIGFDFDGKIGKYSCVENKDKKLKLKKLKWCKYFIELLNKKNKNINYIKN